MDVENDTDDKGTTDIDKAKDTAPAGDGTGGKDTGTDDSKKDDDTSGLKSALDKERKKNGDLSKKLRDAELAKLPELERAQAEVKTLTDENEKLKKENVKLTLALDLELPWNLAKRISGDTEEEMRSDAADLLKDFKRDDEKSNKDKRTPSNDGGKGSPGKAKDMNALLRAAAGKG